MASKTHNHKDMQKGQGISKPQVPMLLPLKKAAEVLGLTVWGMRERIWAGDIPVVRFPGGRKQFIHTQDLQAFVERNKVVFD